ncbi:outer membrane beta-barrel protein [Chitinophaga agrisoli]|uniref:Outer membrane beta-barrel protein n=1 Tax=Chitinophaga agrisoli TaxID=2607653 RepID=A0A5B2VQ82_9BACT|nr:outer membrane beta-barrel protein [Chitinophaga agrisoli]
MRNIWIIFPFLLLTTSVYAQHPRTVKGHIRDSYGNSLPGAVVTLVTSTDSTAVSASAQADFFFNAVKSSRFKLEVGFMGYEKFVRQYKLADSLNTIVLDTIVLSIASTALKEVVVAATVPVKVKEDTIEYDAKAFKVREGDAVDEIVKKLPGVDVDKTGNMSVQGEPITKVRLNGKDFFGNDAAAAIQNLPADIVKNLQVIDDYGDQANITGIKGGESTKILNINLLPDKDEGYYGKLTGGLGTDGRYEGRFRTNILRDKQQIAFDGAINNTESGDGISDRKSAKLNYRDNWGGKLVSYGSYGYTNRNNSIRETTSSQTVFQDYTKLEDESQNSYTGNNQHQLSWNLEYQVDSSNYLKIQPDLSYSTTTTHNAGLSNTQLLGSSSLKDNQSFNNATSSSLSARIFYNHKFKKQGRNFSFTSQMGYSNSDANSDVKNRYTITDTADNISYTNQFQQTGTDNNTFQTSAQASYIEPLSASSYAEVSYQLNRSATSNIRNTNDVDPVSGEQKQNFLQSNDYDYQFTTHRIGLNYRFKQKKLNYMVGMSAQPSVLKGEDFSRHNSTSRSLFNWIPTARLIYRFSRKNTFSARYYGRSQAPGFTQLQPLTDNSDLQNTVTGNPDLKPEFSHNLNLEYKQSDWSSGYTMLAKLLVNETMNKIVTVRTIIPDSLKQNTTYINTNGFYNVKGLYTFSKPFADRKYTLTYFGDAGYSNNIAFTNGERNIGKDLTIRQGFKFRADLDDIMDAELNTAYSFNGTTYSSASFQARRVNSVLIGIAGRNYFFSNWTLGYDFSYTINSGYSTGNVNPKLLNAYLERRLLKHNRGTVRVAVFDLFNQNTGISRDVFDNEIVDKRNNRLARYFMLTLNYRLENFGH